MAKYNVDPAVAFPHHLYQLYSREKPSSLTGLSNAQKNAQYFTVTHMPIYFTEDKRNILKIG